MILSRTEPKRFTRKNSSNIVQCFTSLIVTSLDIIQTSLFLVQKYEKATFEKAHMAYTKNVDQETMEKRKKTLI